MNVINDKSSLHFFFSLFIIPSPLFAFYTGKWSLCEWSDG